MQRPYTIPNPDDRLPISEPVPGPRDDRQGYWCRLRAAPSARAVLTRLMVAACAIVTAGCYDRTRSGGAVVYTFQQWIPLTVGGASLALAAAGVILARRPKRSLGVTMTVVGVFVFVVLSPGTFHDQVVIAPEGLCLDTGFWFAPSKYEVRFADVMRADVEVVVRQGRSGRRNRYYINCRLRSGQTVSFPVGDLMKCAYPEVIETLREKNIPVHVPPNTVVR